MTEEEKGSMSNVYAIVEKIEMGERVTVADLAELTEEEVMEIQNCLPDARITFDPIDT